MQFNNMAFTEGQSLAFQFADKKLLVIAVKEIEVIDFTRMKDGSGTTKRSQLGLLTPNTTVVFEKSDASTINLTGKSKSKQAFTSIINPDWDFNKMGIGGLDNEFSAIFRRAFASRVFPPEVIEQLGMKHVKGILLFGPPGTGKTLMARQIGKMLNAREPKIINGPQILDKYVGESEKNIRMLFAEAEEEEQRCGPHSGLHIIIFDEIDAICKSRGSVAGNTGVHDTVVNQLLSKIDGVNQLNNILVIGMTNRKDMIDEALLRPGRLEVQMEIGLPDEKGRLQILNIHTHIMKENGKLAPDVDIEELAALTKNFSGAEIEGLVKAAQSTAMNRLIKATNKVEVDPDAVEKLLITRKDFIHALEYDCTPAFGSSKDEFVETVPADKFDMNGKALCLLKRSDFMERVPKNGDLLYNALNKLVHKNSGVYDNQSQSGTSYQNIPPAPSSFQIPQQFSSPDQTNGGLVLLSRSSAQTTPVYTTKVKPFVPILPHPANHITKQEILPVTTVPGILSPAPSPSDTGSGSDVDSCPEYDDRLVCRNPMQPSQLNYMNQLRPTMPTGSELVPFLRSKESDCRLLWEFIYQLLQNPCYKEYVCWEKLDDYVFRINNPTGLAQLWGHQKNRTNMTYEKLSRALRYYYRMNIIKKVSGKRLTYKFMQPPANIQKGQRGAKPHSRSHLLTTCKDEEADDFDSEMRSDDTLSSELSQTSIETKPIKLEIPESHDPLRRDTRDKLTRSMSYPGMVHLSSVCHSTDINDQPFDFTMTTLKRKEKSVDDSVSSARACAQLTFPLPVGLNSPESTNS